MGNKNQPAFPVVETTEAQSKSNIKTFYGNVESSGGLTKREYAAIMIMASVYKGWGAGHEQKAAADSIAAADALLAELDKPITEQK